MWASRESVGFAPKPSPGLLAPWGPSPSPSLIVHLTHPCPPSAPRFTPVGASHLAGGNRTTVQAALSANSHPPPHLGGNTHRILVLWHYRVSVCWGCHNKAPWTGWLKQQKLISSQFWRLKVQDQGVGRFGFILRPLSLACRWPSSPGVFTRSFHCAYLCPNLLYLERYRSCWLMAHSYDLTLT